MEKDKNRLIPEDWKKYMEFHSQMPALIHSLLISGRFKTKEECLKPFTYAIIATKKENTCEYMRNVARCKRKYYEINLGITLDCFLDYMRSSDFQVKSWDIRLIDTNNYEKGFKYCIEGYHLIYKKNAN
jgi:hypothetical protein